jgi:hypothetical protein
VVHAGEVAQVNWAAGRAVRRALIEIISSNGGEQMPRHHTSTGNRAVGRGPFIENSRSTRRERRDHHPRSTS